jgi:enhancer of polycomb-like protein
MQSTRASGARFRQRKLSTKHPLQVVKENEIETFAIDEDPQRHIPHVETGVEKAEETEHHLQAVISAAAASSLGAKVNQVFIPTPETKSSGIPYDQLYPRQFAEPATYIRFSSTVEDCIGNQYNIDEEDDVFLLNFNTSKKDDEKLSEDIFEELMSFFDLKSDKSHPFASISNAPVLTLEEAESYYDDPEDETNLSVEARKWAKEVYEHWRSRRVQNGNRSLLSSLKFETGADTDDNDAYVCFRRREVRQARKTRGRDAQVTEKLKKLRRELEDARQLLISVNQRERLIKQRIETERQVFEQRSELKKVKVQQGIKGEKGEDEELLVNQRVSHDVVTVVVVRALMLNSPRQSPDQQRPMVKDLRPCVFLARGQKPSAQPRRTTLYSCQTFRRKQPRRCSGQSKKRLASIASGTRIGSTILGDRSHHQPSLLQRLAICHVSRRFSCRRLQLLCGQRHLKTMPRMSR